MFTIGITIGITIGFNIGWFARWWRDKKIADEMNVLIKKIQKDLNNITTKK